MHEQACQQHCSRWPAQPCSSLSTTLFKLAISTMFKPVKNTIQAGHLNHVQACQEHYSSWPAQPCSSLSTTLFKLTISTMLKPVNSKKHVRFYVCIDKGISLGTKTFVQHRATCSPRFPRVPLTSLYTTRGIAVLFQPGHLHREPRKILGTWYIWWNIWNKMWQKVRTWEISGVCMVLQTCLLL